ncbi:MAG: S49 family peptidase [Alphaproteobacteria bacterium]|nr:S49 family peptidase [Alphaproteobacteria bacterium]
MNLLPHIAGRVFATPLMISRAKLDVIVSIIAPRLQGESLPPAAPSAARGCDVGTDGIAIIPITGTLVRRTVGLEAQSGLTSYAEIAEQVQQAVADPSVKAILLNLDSPGGEAGGVFDLADQIYGARQAKPVWAVANEDAFSAAYALAASAQRLYVTRTGGVGSIGVIAMHLDQSQADTDEGLKYSPIFAGAHKNDYSPHEPLADPARATLQAEVDRVYGLFVEGVARGRNLSPEAVRATEAALFFGENGVAAGLADKIGTFEDALADLSTSLSSSTITLNPSRKVIKMTTQENQPQIEAAKELPNLDALKAEFIEKAKADARAEAMAYVAEVFDLCAIAGVPDKAKDFVSKAVPSAEVRHALLEAKAKEDEATAIVGLPSDNALAATEVKIDTAAIYQNRNNQKGN